MASPFDNRALTPIITSLSRSCLVKIALPLWEEADNQMLFLAHQYIHLGVPEQDFKNVKNLTHRNLLLMPTHLRKMVIDVYHCMNYQVSTWIYDHKYLPKFRKSLPTNKAHRAFYWRSDGSIDRLKTAQRIVLDTNIDVRERFEVACNYCLVEDIYDLWMELEICGQAEHVKTSLSRMTPFWVQRILRGSHDPWPQAALEYLNSSRISSDVHNLSCCRLIFPLLQPEERETFLRFFKFCTGDDLRISLYLMTKEEQEKALSDWRIHYKVLYLYLLSPLQSFFLEIAKKTWHHIEKITFTRFLDSIFIVGDERFGSIVMELCNMSPDYFREWVMAGDNRKRFDSMFKRIREKRKADDEFNEEMKKQRLYYLKYSNLSGNL